MSAATPLDIEPAPAAEPAPTPVATEPSRRRPRFVGVRRLTAARQEPAPWFAKPWTPGAPVALLRPSAAVIAQRDAEAAERLERDRVALFGAIAEARAKTEGRQRAPFGHVPLADTRLARALSLLPAAETALAAGWEAGARQVLRQVAAALNEKPKEPK